MQLNFRNKVVLVTGSSKGIGLHIAEKLHELGAKVIVNGRSNKDVKIAVDRLPGSIGIVADVSDPSQASRLVVQTLEKTGKLDGLVCNVGGGQSVRPGCENYKEWQRVFAQNLWSATNMVESSTDALQATNGAIVCISSICGQEVVLGAPVTYSAAKAALNSFVRGISRPLADKGIRINAIAPGNIVFDGSTWQKKIETDSESVSQLLDANVAMKKLGKPGDISNLVVYLLSSVANFATGAVWTIDGGQTRR